MKPRHRRSKSMTDVNAGPSRFYYSTNRGHDWRGPYRLPLFDQKGIAARTDYVVNGPHRPKFRRLRNTAAPCLGLAISRKCCQLMGGEITVQSESGQGSAFTMTLPAVVEAGRVKETK